MMTLRVASNYDCIAAANSMKPKRHIDEDRAVEEAPLYVEGEEHDLGGDRQTEGAEARAWLGFGSLGQNTHIGHRLAGADLEEVLNFETRERNTKFYKELKKLPLMRDGKLPLPLEDDAVRERTKLQREVLQPCDGGKERGQGRRLELTGELREVAEAFRKHFKQKDGKAIPEEDSELDVPEPDAIVDAARPSTDLPAFFAPDDRWRRPSDFVCFMARQFEAGLTGKKRPPGADPILKELTEDQVFVLVMFAYACNCVWEDEQNDVPMNRRRCFDMLIMGQGGSGKTAIVQEIVLPVIDFLFPPDAESNPPETSLVVCASWAQADNISIDKHKAVSCHSAGMVRVESMRNADMAAGEKLSALERK